VKQRQGSTLAALQRVQEFLDGNGTTFASVNKSSARRALDDTVGQTDTHVADQGGGALAARGERARQRQLRQALRKYHMRPIAMAALLKLRDVPEVVALTMPTSNMSRANLAQAATAMAEAAKAHEAVLIEAGLPDDFIAQLIAATAAFAASLTTVTAGLRRRVGATSGLGGQDRRGRYVIRILDAAVLPIIGTDDKLLAQWRTASRIPAKPGPVGGSGAPPVPKPTPTPVIAPAKEAAPAA
jgi:hypothetical protein